MSITSRINEMSSHIEQAYDELQGLGADLTNVNKNIENISMVLDDIYDSMPQISGEGTSLTLDDTRVGKIKSTLKGNTSQSGTPTPTTPIPVNVVSGDNEINVVGKNLLLNNGITETKNGITFTKNEDNTITLNGTATADTYTNVWLSTTSNLVSDTSQVYTMSIGVSNANLGLGIYEYINNSWSNKKYVYAESTTYTPSGNQTGQIFRVIVKNGAVLNNVIVKPMLVKGTTVGEYEPSQDNTYNIDLLEGMELCKIGNYQDYIYKDSDKWYLHKEIGKIVLNGSENWGKSSAYSTSTYFAGFTTVVTNVIKQNSYNVICDNFTLGSYISVRDNECIANNEKSINIQILASRLSENTADALKTWLSTHNTEVYYILATPTNTEITYQPLIDQLNELEKAQSKENQTNISQVNNDLPFIISASALKEWQENASLNSTLSMANPLSLGNTLNTQENNIQPIEVDNIEPLEEEENEES